VEDAESTINGILSDVARPSSALIDLAAGRSPSIEGLDISLVRSATEHRMQGLLYTWAAAHQLVDGEAGAALTAAEARSWARNQLLAVHAGRLEKSAAAHGVDVTFIKGVALESQIYMRSGERPTSDIDICIRGGTTEGIAGWVASLQPHHMWVPHLTALLGGHHIQSVDLVVDGIEVDIHFDPLKLEIVESRHPADLLSRTATCDLGSGSVTGLDAEANLVLALLHLNKDRFRSLIGFSDVRRLLNLVEDWDWIVSYAAAEGLRTPILASLDVVTSTLELVDDVPRPGSLGQRLWSVAWPERVRLLGREGLVRFRYRQMLIPLFGGGRAWEAARGMLRRIFPPAPMVRAFYPNARGGYLRTLVSGRTERRRQRAQQRRTASTGPTPSE
jgi:hypothetical protein